MTLFLDCTQRLNLHFLMGAQRGSVDDVRLWWRLQDRIELSEAEKAEINFRVAKIGDMEQPMWDLKPDMARGFDFADDELARISKLIKEWPHGFTGNDRRWLEPLLGQLAAIDGKGAQDAPREVTVHSGNRSRND